MQIVVLRTTVEETDLALFSAVLYRDRKRNANFLRCKEVDDSHLHYLCVKAQEVSGKSFTQLYLPHSIVLMIVGSKRSHSNAMGFVWKPKSHSRSTVTK